MPWERWAWTPPLATGKLHSCPLISLSVSTEPGSGPRELRERVSSPGRSCPPWAVLQPSYRPQVSTSGHRKDGGAQRRRGLCPCLAWLSLPPLGFLAVWRLVRDSLSLSDEGVGLTPRPSGLGWLPWVSVPPWTARFVRAGMVSCSQRCP